MAPWLLAAGWAHFGRQSTAEIRFKRAVPRRADRRELRSLLRRAARSEKSAADRHVAETLNQLATRRVPLAAVRVQPDDSEVVQFIDGTELVVDVVGNILMIDRIRGGGFRGARLSQATPCMGRNWYRLWLVPPHAAAVEVMAKVTLYFEIY